MPFVLAVIVKVVAKISVGASTGSVQASCGRAGQRQGGRAGKTAGHRGNLSTRRNVETQRVRGRRDRAVVLDRDRIDHGAVDRHRIVAGIIGIERPILRKGWRDLSDP